MKHTLMAVFLFLSSPLALAGANDMVVQQRNSTNSGNLQYHVISPAGPYGIFYYDKAGVTMKWAELDSSLEINSGVLRAVIPSMPVVPTKTSDLTNDSGFITSAPVASVNAKTGAVTLTNTDVGAAAEVHSHSISDVSGLSASLSGKFNSPSGSASQYVRGDGSIATFPAIPDQPVTYSGTTNSSGVYSVTYSSPYAAKPRVIVQIEGGTNKDSAVITSSTVSGFSVLVERRTDLLGLLPSYSNVNGATVNVAVFPQ